MNNLFLSIIAGIFFLISWFLQYFLSKREGKLNKFKNHFMAFRVDWLLFPFNLFFPFAIKINLESVILSFFMGLYVTTIMHNHWSKISVKNIEDGPFFKKGSREYTKAGRIHYFFSIIQATLLIIFIFNKIINLFSYLCLGLLVLFILLGFYSSKRIHGRLQKSDALWLIISIFVLILSFFLF